MQKKKKKLTMITQCFVLHRVRCCTYIPQIQLTRQVRNTAPNSNDNSTSCCVRNDRFDGISNIGL